MKYIPVIFRATGASENPDYWPLGNVSNDGSCYAKANSKNFSPFGFWSTRASGPANCQ